MAGPGGIRWWKDAGLADQLDAYYREWAGCGRPTIRDYRLSCRPIGQSTDPPADGWHIQRRFHQEIIEIAADGGTR